MAAYEYAKLELKPMLAGDYGAQFFAVHEGRIVGFVEYIDDDGGILLRPSWRNFRPKKKSDA